MKCFQSLGDLIFGKMHDASSSCVQLFVRIPLCLSCVIESISNNSDWMVYELLFLFLLLAEIVCFIVFKFWIWCKTSYFSLFIGCVVIFVALGFILYLCDLMYIDGSCVELACSPPACSKECVKGISLTTYIMSTATLSTAIVALFKDKFEKWIDCPRLVIRETHKDVEDKNGTKCFIYRIVVENVGRTPAENLKIMLERVDGSDHAPFDLRWSFSQKNVYEPVKLHSNLKRMWDLCGKSYDGDKLFIGADTETDALRKLDKGTYKFKMYAVADNLNTFEKNIIITYKDSEEQVDVEIV